MILISAASLLYDLRCIRMALSDHNTHLGATLATLAAADHCDYLIGMIEDVSTLLCTTDPLRTAQEAGVGAATVRDPAGCGRAACASCADQD